MSEAIGMTTALPRVTTHAAAALAASLAAWRKHAWIWVCLLGGLAAAVYLILPGQIARPALMAAASFASAAVTIVAIRLRAPSMRRPWRLLVGFQIGWGVSWAAWAIHVAALGPVGAGSLAYTAFLPWYPVLAAVLISLSLAQGRAQLVASQSALIALALFDVAWLVLVDRYFAGQPTIGLSQLTPLGYTLGDAGLLAVLLRLAVSGRHRSAGALLLLAGGVALIASDGLWNWAAALGGYSLGSWADLGWLFVVVLPAAAALHPAMPDTFTVRPGPAPRRRITFVLSGVASLVAPVTLVFVGGDGERALPIVISALLTIAVALQMLWQLVRRADRLNAELEQQNRTLIELDGAKDRFVACVSHELRTPLTSIRGYIELVLEEAETLTDDQQRFLATVERNSDRLLHLVDDLLYVARVNAERVEIERSPVDLEALAAEAVETAKPIATHAGVALSLSVDRAAPGRLLGDREQLLRLLDNLLSNAIKFTPGGGAVTVETHVVDSEAWLVVNDTGIGMSTADAARVFDRFFRTWQADELAIQGTGIGLTIVKAIATAHGGDVRVVPRPEGGTSVAVRLPTTGVETPAGRGCPL